MGKLAILNIALFIAVIALFINLAGPKDITAKVVFSLDQSEPKCIFELQDKQTIIDDMSVCCFELQKQLACTHDNTINGDFICSTSSYGAQYKVNAKAINYCTTQGYRIKTK